jgi:hypothetical protein
VHKPVLVLGLLMMAASALAFARAEPATWAYGPRMMRTVEHLRGPQSRWYYATTFALGLGLAALAFHRPRD